MGGEDADEDEEGRRMKEAKLQRSKVKETEMVER